MMLVGMKEVYLKKTRYEILINVIGIEVEYIMNAVKVDIFRTLLERISNCCLDGTFVVHLIQAVN